MTDSEITTPSRHRHEQVALGQTGRTTWLGRLARGLFGGMLAGLVASAADTFIAHSAQAPDARAPGFVVLFLHDWGVVAPLLTAVALVFAALAILAHPASEPTWRGYLAWLRGGDMGRTLNRALLVPLGIVGSWLWVVAMAHVARMLLSTVQNPRTAGLAVGGAGVLIGLVCGLLVLMMFAGLRSTLAHRRKDVRRRFRADWTAGLALLLCAGTVAWGISSGTTGGEGGVFGFLGVLKRIELDLRPVTLTLLVALGAFTLPAVLRKVPSSAALVLALAPLGLTVRSAVALEGAPKVAVALEQSSPLGKNALRVLRRATDRDHDGAAAYFGGGDCDDRNRDINPMAIDKPSNGVDEDCSGDDLVLATAPAAPRPSSSAAAPVPPPDAPKLPGNLNVILVSIDTLRWDVGYMGYPRPTTPALDALAAKAVVFEKTYALASYTGKAIGPMISGKFPSETNMGWKHYNTFPKTEIMVQERLQDAGIHTMAIHCHWYFKPQTGLGRGFTVFDLSALPPQGIDATTDTTYSADRLTDAAIRVLSDASNTSKRFYAWLHYFDPHAEYMRHEGVEKFGNKVRDMYDHEVRWTDDHLGRLLQFVEKQPWSKNTAIIVTSDHGEAFGEHKMYRHGLEVWEEIVRVPLVVYVPGLDPRRVKQRRSLIDLVPTIMNLMGVAKGTPKGDFDLLSGTSLVPDMLSGKDATLPQRDILVDMPGGPFNEARRAFIHGDMKLVIAGGVRYQLFDLASDPEEKSDLSDDKAKLK
ncbi:MAG: sulfatase, partial [Polyangiaceae bacterium]|nr:sulfatase [Polyangiaceae bacterium]